MKQKIYLSPSDQDRNLYAAGNTSECEQCRKIAAAAVEELTRCGFQVRSDPLREMEERVALSNEWGADLHICIHTNACNGQVQGTRLFSYDVLGTGYQACKAVMAALSPITPGRSDSITAWPGLYEVRHANAPTVYIEVAFHDNPEEARWIISHTREIAQAITKGICRFYETDYKAPPSPGIYNSLDEVPQYARATVEKLLNSDLLFGTQQGLELTEDMLRLLVINDRAGLYH